MIASPAFALILLSLVAPAAVLPHPNCKQGDAILHKSTRMVIAAISAGLSAWKSWDRMCKIVVWRFFLKKNIMKVDLELPRFFFFFPKNFVIDLNFILPLTLFLTAAHSRCPGIWLKTAILSTFPSFQKCTILGFPDTFVLQGVLLFMQHSLNPQQALCLRAWWLCLCWQTPCEIPAQC